MAEWYFFYLHLSFFNWKSRDECYAAFGKSVLAAFARAQHWQMHDDFHVVISNWFQIASQKTRRRSQTKKGLSEDGVRAKFCKKISARLPLIRTFRMSPLFARSISLDSNFKAQYRDFVSIRFEHLLQVFFSLSSKSSNSYITSLIFILQFFNIEILMYVLSMYRKKILSLI